MKLKFEVEVDVDTDAGKKEITEELADYIKVGCEDFSPNDTEYEDCCINDVTVTSK